MARRKEGQKLLNDPRRLVTRVEIVLHVGERKDLAALRFLDDVGVGDSANRALAELHLVACESPRLVAEDVLDLAQLLNK